MSEQAGVSDWAGVTEDVVVYSEIQLSTLVELVMRGRVSSTKIILI